MNKINGKHGFTMAEVLLSFVIVGIISILSFQTLKVVHNKYDNAYYSALNILTQSAGNAVIKWNEENIALKAAGSTSIGQSDNWQQYQETPAVQKLGVYTQYPNLLLGAFDDKADNQEFCKRLKSLMNTVDEENNCQSFLTETNSGSDDVGRSFKEMFGNCSSGSCKMPVPSFSTTNKLDFYITDMTAATDTNHNFYEEVLTNPQKIYFRFVAVDLNGEKKPNNHLKQGNTLPDIVWFAISSDGAIIPLGRPEIDSHYLRANVIYPEYLDKDVCNNTTGSNAGDNKPDFNLRDNSKCNMDETNPPIVKSNSMTLLDAKITAWGNNYFNTKTPYSYPVFLAAMSKENASDTLFKSIVKQIYYEEIGSDKNLIENYTTTTSTDTAHGCSTINSRCNVSSLR